jgi:FkbM family methyltransferase
MLIPMKEIVEKYNIKPTGILHVGAHECEEFNAYVMAGVPYTNIHWVEAMQNKVDKMKEKYGDKLNMHQSVIDLEDNKEISFKITSNGESSSILDFGTHSSHHPHVTVTDTIMLKTSRLDTLIDNKNIPIDTIDFLNFDIQGVELRALQSMEKYLTHIKYIYTEVNTEQVYKDCAQINEIDTFLQDHGFERKETRIYKQFGWGDALYIKK